MDPKNSQKTQKSQKQHENKPNLQNVNGQNGHQPNPNPKHQNQVSQQMPNHHQNSIVNGEKPVAVYQKFTKIIQNSGFKSINGNVTNDYKIAKKEFQLTQFEHVMKACVKQFPTMATKAADILQNFKNKQQHKQSFGVQLSNSTFKAVKLIWKKQNNNCLIGYQSYNFQFLLNQNIIISNDITSQQSQGVNNYTNQQGQQFEQKYKASFNSSHETMNVDPNPRQFNEQDLKQLIKICKINNNKLPAFLDMLKDAEDVDY